MTENLEIPETWPQIKTVGLAGVIVTFSGALSEPANRAAIAFRAAVGEMEWRDIEEINSTLVSTFLRINLSVHKLGTNYRTVAGIGGQQGLAICTASDWTHIVARADAVWDRTRPTIG